MITSHPCTSLHQKDELFLNTSIAAHVPILPCASTGGTENRGAGQRAMRLVSAIHALRYCRMDLAYTSAAELAGLIRRRAVSPVEVTRATLDRIERSQPVLNAFITIADDAAMDGGARGRGGGDAGRSARPAARRAGRGEGPGPDRGSSHHLGLADLQGPRPGHDAVVVARLKQAGAIIVGKTTTPEFGQQCLTQAPLFGRTRNAWRGDRTSGGFSGGSAVAVAAGLVPIAVATDGGGSTRIPAACNGVVGFKQGLGVVPQEYAQDGFGNISYITPMTRTVADTALMLDVMAGTDLRDPLSTGRPKWDFVAAAQAGRSDRTAHRVACASGQYRGRVLGADRLRGRAGAFAELGAAVSELTTPFENPESVWFVNNGAYRRAQFGHHLERHRAIMCPTFVRQMDRVATYSAAELYEAIFERTRLYRQVQAWFDTAATSSPCRPCRGPRCRSIRTSSARSRSTTRSSRTSAPPGIPTPCRST